PGSLNEHPAARVVLARVLGGGQRPPGRSTDIGGVARVREHRQDEHVAGSDPGGAADVVAAGAGVGRGVRAVSGDHDQPSGHAKAATRAATSGGICEGQAGTRSSWKIPSECHCTTRLPLEVWYACPRSTSTMPLSSSCVSS